ncbi:hypothetical protein FYB92_00305 [Novacetimonas sp. GS1]
MFLVTLFLKSFRRRRLFKKRRHPKTFLVFIKDLFANNLLPMSCFQTLFKGSGGTNTTRIAPQTQKRGGP